MRFAYLGTDGFAASVLGRLVEAGRTPVAVITRPDSRQGRGRRLAPPPAAVAAVELGIELAQPDAGEPGTLEAAVDATDADLLVLCAYGVLIGEPILSDHLILNLHPSLLPRWRGAAPIERALMAGDLTTGASVMRLVEELDAGPVAACEEVPVAHDDDFASLSAKLEQAGTRLLLDAMTRFEDGTLEFSDQSTAGITYADRIEAADRLLDLSRPAVESERRVRALRPHIGARLELPDGSVIGVRAAEVVRDGPPSGTIAAGDDGLLVGFAEGVLRVSRVVPAGGREMDAADWLRGGGLPPGVG